MQYVYYVHNANATTFGNICSTQAEDTVWDILYPIMQCTQNHLPFLITFY